MASWMQIGREPNRQKEHIWRDFQYRVDNSSLVPQEVEIRGTQFSRGRVHGNKFGCMQGYMDEEDYGRVVRFTLRSYCDIL